MRPPPTPLVLLFLLFVGLHSTTATGGPIWTAAETCCLDCSYVSECCCAPRDALPVLVVATRTKRVGSVVTKTRWKRKWKTKTRSVTVTANAPNFASKKAFEPSPESGIEAENETAAVELDVQVGDLQLEPLAVDDDVGESEASISSTSFDLNRESLHKRHLCLRCPARIALASYHRESAETAVGSNSYIFCCPARKTRTKLKTVTRLAAHRRTVYVTRTRTGTRVVVVTRTAGTAMLTTLQGTLFRDLNGDKIRQPAEPVSVDIQLSLFLVVSASTGRRARASARLQQETWLADAISSSLGSFTFQFAPIPVGSRLFIRRKDAGGGVSPLSESVAGSVDQMLVPDSGPWDLATSMFATLTAVEKKTTSTRKVMTSTTGTLGLTSAVELPTTSKGTSSRSSPPIPPKTMTGTSEERTASETLLSSESKTASETTTDWTVTSRSSTTKTTFTRTTSRTKTSSTSLSTTTSQTRTVQTIAAGYTPSISNGSVGGITWTTEWNVDQLGYPLPTVQLLCMAYGDFCNGTVLASSGSPVPADAGPLSVVGLEMEHNYTCFARFARDSNSWCTAGTTVIMGAGWDFTLSHPNGSAVVYDEVSTGYKIGISGPPAVFRVYAKAGESYLSELKFVMLRNATHTSNWVHRGWYMIGAKDPQSVFQFWKNPSGGVAIFDYDSRWSGYDETGNWVSNGVEPPLSNWIMRGADGSAVPEALFYGTLSAPSQPPPPGFALAGIEPFEQNILNYQVYKSDVSGSPPATYTVTCVDLDAPVDSLPVYHTSSFSHGGGSSESAKAIGTMWFGGYYTCYTCAYNIMGKLCSEGFSFMVPMPSGTLHTIKSPSNQTWKISNTDSVSIVVAGGTEAEFFIYNGTNYLPITSGGGPFAPSRGFVAAMFTPNSSQIGVGFPAGEGNPYLMNAPLAYYRFWRAGLPGKFGIETRNRYGGEWLLGLRDDTVNGWYDVAPLIWTIDPEPSDQFVAGNLTLPDVPDAPNPGSFTFGLWLASFTVGFTGLPPANFKVICVLAGLPLNVSDPTVLSVAVGNNMAGMVMNGTQYDCYSVGTNLVGTVISVNSTRITAEFPPATTYNFTMFGTGAAVVIDPTTNLMSTNPGGVDVSFDLDDSSCCGGSPGYFYVAGRRADGSGNMLLSAYAGDLRATPYPSGGGFSFVGNSSTGYSLVSIWGFFIGINPGTNSCFINADASNVALFDVQPPPPANKTIGTFREPVGIASNLTGYLSDNTFIVSWVFPTGADAGFPAAQYQPICLPFGLGCTNTTALGLRVGANVEFGTNTGSVPNLNSGSVYTCYVVTRHFLGDQCLNDQNVTVTAPA